MVLFQYYPESVNPHSDFCSGRRLLFVGLVLVGSDINLAGERL